MSFQHEPSESATKFDHHSQPSDGHDGPSPKLILAAIVAVIIVIFIVANDKTTTISFWLFKWETTIRWSIFIAILLGIALDRLLIWGFRRHNEPKKSKNLPPPSKD